MLKNFFIFAEAFIICNKTHTHTHVHVWQLIRRSVSKRGGAGRVYIHIYTHTYVVVHVSGSPSNACRLQPSAFLAVLAIFQRTSGPHTKSPFCLRVREYVIFKCFLHLLVCVQARAAISSPFYAICWCLIFLSAFLYKTIQFISIQYYTIL